MHACNMFKDMQKMAAIKTLAFKVHRKDPELIPPAESTPHELKFLSDIDDQKGLRCHFPMMNFYSRNPSMEGKDLVRVIRDAIAKALVFYYPLAGRLREYSGGKLAVESTGEGVVFIEADADVALEEFGDALYPPFPNVDELLHVQGFDRGLNSPLMLFQVTRLKCGGFILAYIFNHTMCDGAGIQQIMCAVGELARGGVTPTVPPVWERHLLSARQPPRVSFTHHEYEQVVSASYTSGGTDGFVVRSFLFSSDVISALRRSLPPHLRSCSKFDVVAGCAWRCRTIALASKHDEEIRFLCSVNVRKRMNPPLPAGYYGNAVVSPAAVTTAHELSKNPLQYAVELVRKAKSEATEEYVRSVADLMVMRDRPSVTTAKIYMVSDLTHAGLEQPDFGWGAAAYGGVARGIYGSRHQLSWYIPCKNGIVVPVCLPLDAMKVFIEQLQVMTTTTARMSSAL